MIISHFIGILAILSATMLWSAQNSSVNSLERKLNSFKWQKRVILVITSSSDEKEFIEQKNKIELKKAGIEERDLEILYVVINNLDDTDKTFLRKKFEIQEQKFCIILIGKDGGEKRRSHTPLLVDDLFQTIDAMPMRKQEMRSKNK